MLLSNKRASRFIPSFSISLSSLHSSPSRFSKHAYSSVIVQEATVLTVISSYTLRASPKFPPFACELITSPAPTRRKNSTNHRPIMLPSFLLHSFHNPPHLPFSILQACILLRYQVQKSNSSHSHFVKHLTGIAQIPVFHIQTYNISASMVSETIPCSIMRRYRSTGVKNSNIREAIRPEKKMGSDKRPLLQ